jgi:hypothetical protein
MAKSTAFRPARGTLPGRPAFAPARIADEDSLTRVLFEASAASLSRAELHERLDQRIQSWLALACRWEPRAMAGRFRVLTLSFEPAAGVRAFVRFWCEPNRPVRWEVCSGRTDEATALWLGHNRVERIRAFGFEVGGAAELLQMPVVIRSGEDTAHVAYATVEILAAALDYHGEQALRVELEAGIHVPAPPVFESMTPLDLAEAMAQHGYAVVSFTDGPEMPALLFQRRGLHTTVEFSDRVAETRSFRTVGLTCNLEPRADEVARLTAAARAILPPGVVPVVRMGTTLNLGGGVTGNWIDERLAEWTRMTDQYRQEQQERRREVKLARFSERVH